MTLSKQEKAKYLKILGLPHDATLTEIEFAYRKLRDIYSSEISLLSPLVADFPAEKKEDILKELEEANRKIRIQMEHEQALPKLTEQGQSEKGILQETRQKDAKFNRPIMDEIKEKLCLEETKLKQDYVNRIDDLMSKGAVLLKSLNEIMKQLENLGRRLPWKNEAQIDLLEKLNCLKTKVDDIKKAYSHNQASALEYGWTVVPADQVGPFSIQMSLLRDSICQCQGAPTQTHINQFISMERKIVALLASAEEIKEKDIPDLNITLKEFDIPMITISRILHHFP